VVTIGKQDLVPTVPAGATEALGNDAAPTVTVVHPALLIRINQLFRPDMSPLELYEVTRGVWKLGVRREKAQYGLAVFGGVVREVYEIQSWHPALTNAYETRGLEHHDVTGRWEFLGAVADEEIRGRYRGRSVRHYFRKGMQNPTIYVNC